MGKITNPHLMTLCVMKIIFKKDKYQPIAVWEVKLNYIHIYVHNH
jgi:hypothetical protein